MKSPREELREKLAAIEHERWADWQKWCHKILRENCPSSNLEAVLERWDKQISKNYKELSDKEKASDMEQVDRYWPLILALITKERQTLTREILEALPEAAFGLRGVVELDKAAQIIRSKGDIK